MKTTAIIVAAGSGSRFKSDIPKQFVEIRGKPVLVHTLDRFESAPSVDSVVLVLSHSDAERFDKSKFRKLTSVVAGGPTRAESVKNGLMSITDETEIVAVHDGVRPLVTVDEIERTISKANQTGAACLVSEVTDTIKSVRGGEIAATLDRGQLRRALTPQAFNIKVLRKAFESAKLDESVTDECYLVEKLGHPIAIVVGSPLNIKITHALDLAFAEKILESADRKSLGNW